MDSPAPLSDEWFDAIATGEIDPPDVLRFTAAAALEWAAALHDTEADEYDPGQYGRFHAQGMATRLRAKAREIRSHD